MMKRIKQTGLSLAAVAIVLALLTVSGAPAQQRTIYGADGKVTGRVTTDSANSTTIYDAAGRVTGRTSTDSQGTTTIYDANGRSTGSVTGKPRSRDQR